MVVETFNTLENKYFNKNKIVTDSLNVKSDVIRHCTFCSTRDLLNIIAFLFAVRML